MSDQFTQDQLQKALPRNLKNRVNTELVDKLNALVKDPLLRDSFAENMLSYIGVMQDGKYKLNSYIDAVRYVSHKMMGASNIEAYSRTFPDRIKRLTSEGADSKTISSYVAAYNKTQLVNKIMEQTMIPVHILNAHVHQKAINVQASLMVDDEVSAKVRSDAANSLLTHLKPPETTQIEMDINIKEDKTIDALRQSTLALVEQQRQMMEKNTMSAKDVAQSKLIQGECEDITNVDGT